MKRIYLGELEELVLLFVMVMKGEAYGVAVKEALAEQVGRKVNISAIHAALRRLEEKGFVRSEWSEATAVRGGRRKRVFFVSQAGIVALEHVRDTRLKLWNQIPGFNPSTT